MEHRSLNHESASKHVSGEAVYIDDILVNEELLIGRIVYSPHAHAKITSFDVSEAKKSGVFTLSFAIRTFQATIKWVR
jgi:xanthine dehydrogenase molybdopterin-binding subunit B